MLNPLKFLLIYQLKSNYSQKANQNRGFTLLELLVGLAMALLILTPLLGFLINIMTSDRQEQAKATTEQDIQAALDYISRDMQQAVYIYDADDLTNSSSSTPRGIRDQIPYSPATGCPTGTTCTPKLAFWKRKDLPNKLPLNLSATSASGCTATTCNDAFVYSLVVYYQIKDTTCGSSVWSCANRIGRFEIQDGVKKQNLPAAQASSSNPNPDPVISDYLTDVCPNVCPDSGFKVFNLQLGVQTDTISQKMNLWTKASGAYTKPLETLIDYIDDSSEGLKVTFKDANPALNITDVVAEVSIRGNALARINRGRPPVYNANSKNTIAYFPTAKTQIKGRGLLGASN